MAAGSWALVEELFTRGDAAFGSELRRVHAPEQLGAFAARWFADKRPVARQALFDYLGQPLNCYRHEPLVKRLFKLAETAGDDELVGAFLVAFDRSIRRLRKQIQRTKYENFPTRAAAEGAVRAWEAEGFRNVSIQTYAGNRTFAYASKPVEVVVTPNTAMPRLAAAQRKRVEKPGDWFRERLERRHVLFSLPTRRYLRRRAWRYFRRLGKTDPLRYVRAVAVFLARYRDADVDSDLHLLDNWGLTHALFHNCPALVRPARGWEFVPGKGLADLAFAPRLETAWAAKPEWVFDLLTDANCRTVRLFAVWLLRTKCDEWLRQRPVGTLLRLADHADPDVAALGFDLLEAAPDLSVLPVSEWLRRLDGDDLEKLTRLSDLLVRRLDPARVGRDDAIRLAAYRSRPVAVLGLTLLKARAYAADDVPQLLTLAQAECPAVRPDLTAWLRGLLGGSLSEAAAVLDFLDSKHADVRRAGWAWLLDSPTKDDPDVWHKLMESPYDDVRQRLGDQLTSIAGGANPATVRQLWATILLAVHRGGRQKPGVVAQVVRQMIDDPGQVASLLPLLAVAVRSLRGPEFRAGLTGVVALGETRPELLPLIRRQFPELTV
ncbi:hypothetical protein [Limnoglobus roseus]|uniref:Uncharacterized protein n=1 Tax=Limnoglobus roseus TaxID=2598579 RepID=A0A5C1AEZ2_9BACT|nr:hypothetical protein [Limnoglobus roseus]QEL17115.1 hypothetical protein PX52LOC_04096 [Limnoglobus roseus]